VDTPAGELSGLRRLHRIVCESARYPRVILDGSEREELLVAATLARRKLPPAVVIADATWKAGGNVIDYLASHLGLLGIDGPHVRYCVHSTVERERFPRTWHVDPERVLFTPYHHTLSDEDLAAPVSSDGGVFAGGDSLRDYRSLIEAMRSLPYSLTIATRRAGAELTHDLPANVTVSALSSIEFKQRIASASVIVVPLEAREDRGAGQTTYLNALALGKPVIVTDVAGARDHILDGHTGLIVPPGDTRALEGALSALLGDPHRARQMGDAARRDVLDRFGPDRYVEQLLAVVDAAADAQPPRARGG
jgi:glycosyltransferase involved in cell wall biosynthesis